MMTVICKYPSSPAIRGIDLLAFSNPHRRLQARLTINFGHTTKR